MSFSIGYPWILLLASLLLATGGSYFLYRNNPLKLTNKFFVYALYVLRFLTLFGICFLLLGPLIKWINHRTEKPIIVFAIDNSQSILCNKDSAYYHGVFKEELNQLKDKIGKQYQLKVITFGAKQTPDGNIGFDEKLTNISDVFLSVQNNYYNLNLAAVILASDGIYNQGSNPLYATDGLKCSIYTIALGDTLQRRDALIKQVRYNQLVYEGNAFEILVELKAFYCKNEALVVKVLENGVIIHSQNIRANDISFFNSMPFTIGGAKEGFHNYTLRIQNLSNEMSYINNESQIQVNVIKSKQKIVLLALSPHPDISAIRQSLEANPNYEVKFSLLNDFNNEWLDEASLFILHQIPGYRGEGVSLVSQLSKRNIPCLFILGRQSNIPLLAQLTPLQISGPIGNFNEAQALYPGNFNSFQLDMNQLELLPKFAPLIAPYGTYKIPNDASVLFNQQIGYVKTGLPLLFFTRSKGIEQAFLCGEGFWRWRLMDYFLNGNHDFTQSILSKTVQLVAGKDDKSKFRVNAAKKVFDENEAVQIEAELYNDAYELMNEAEIELILKNEKGKTYKYTFSKTDKAYLLETGALPPGDYYYEAKVAGINKFQKKTGKFLIRALQTELLQTKADHQLLYNIAHKNGGKLFYPNNMQSVLNELSANENIKPVIYAQNEVKELMHQKWLFGLLILLLSLEWFIRKWNGFI